MAARLARLLLIIAASLSGCRSGTQSVTLDYETAAERIHQDTERARQLNREAVELLEKGRLDDAEQVLKRALSADVMFGPAHNNLGKVYYHQSKMYLAAWEFQHASRLMPHHPEPRNNLGLVFEAAGRMDEAVAWYDQALQLEPDNPLLIGNLARARLRRGDRDEETRSLLSDLVLKDRRPEWVDWAREHLTRISATSTP